MHFPFVIVAVVVSSVLPGAVVEKESQQNQDAAG